MNEIIKEQIRQEDQPTLCPDCKESLGDCDCKIELGEPDKLPEHLLMYGWICPRCGTVHSPFTMQCGCPPPTKTWNSTTTEEI